MRLLALCFSMGVIVAATALPACSDDAPKSDSTLNKDAAADQSQKDGTSGDGPQADGFTPDTHDDGPGGRELGSPDGSANDGSSADGAGKRCGVDADCKVFQDCCSCRGIRTNETPAICKAACKQPTCDVWFTQPAAYCVNGRCKVGEGAANTCGSATKGCLLINDCCRCLAVPASNGTIPKCTIQSCLVATCTGEGLGAARAQCVQGNCRLSTAP